jgi:hypothetical protein
MTIGVHRPERSDHHFVSLPFPSLPQHLPSHHQLLNGGGVREPIFLKAAICVSGSVTYGPLRLGRYNAIVILEFG